MAATWPGHRRLTWGFVAIGLALRLWHYAVNHTIWYDEAVLLANVLNKDYAELLGPLNHAVAAPPIFLWGLKLLSQICGDEPYCWRFVPFACSCGTLLLTVPLVRRALSPSVGVIAVALVALSDNHVWLGCTIKPYAGDALLTTALLYFYYAAQEWSAVKRLALLAVLIPPILCASYPAVFILGGMLLALLPAAYRERFRGLASWAVASAAALVTFACLYFGPIQKQRVEGLVSEWDSKFPKFHEPETLPGWVIETTTTTFQYCFNPVGFYLCAVAPFGILATWRRSRVDLAVLLVTPFLLAMIAAALKAYPFGFNRLMFFIAPCALLLGGLGIDAAFRYFSSKRLHLLTGGSLIAISLFLPVFHIVKPWDRPDSSGAAAHIRGHRIEGDRVASDEQTYVYFFRGELLSLDDAAATLPVGTRLWVPMDHYDHDGRLRYIDWRLNRVSFELEEATRLRDSSVFLFVKR